MKKYFLTLIVMLPELLIGQYNYMALTFGLSHPVGSYVANKNLRTDGFALNGFTADYSGAYYFMKHFAIAGDLKFTSNGIDVNSAENLLKQEIPLGTYSDTLISYQLGYWKHVSFLAGPQFTIGAGKFNIDLYALAGLSIVMNPTMDVTVIIDNQSYKRTTSPQYARFGFDVGTAFRYKINDNYGIRLFMSYFQTSAKGKIQDEVIINTKQVDIKSYSTNVCSLNIGIGVVYVLNEDHYQMNNEPSSY
jgi:hypothetical protein